VSKLLGRTESVRIPRSEDNGGDVRVERAQDQKSKVERLGHTLVTFQLDDACGEDL
jgi:hypothetical protein